MTDTETPQIGTTIRIPIGELVVDSNIRKNATVPPDMQASVALHGVLVPVDAYHADGAWHLQDGQIRYLASLAAGHTDIPAIVQDPALAEAARLERQVILNELRTAVTDSDRAGAYQALFELGITAEDIIASTSSDPDKVTKALRVKQSPYGAEVLDSGAVTLDQAAIIIDFEDDPSSVATLLQTAIERPGNFDHAVNTARHDREERERAAKALEKITKAGIPVIDTDSPEYAAATPLDAVYLDEALTKKATIAKTKDAGLHGHVTSRNDWSHGRYQLVFEPTYVIVDPTGNGFYTRPTTATGKPAATDEERAERRRVIANNKAWPLATEVRTTWIKDNLLARRELPTGVDKFIATSMAGGHLVDSSDSGVGTARAMLEIPQNNSEHGWYQELVHEIEKKPGNANRIALAIAIGRCEGGRLSRSDAWRVRDSDLTKLARYLNALAMWGYALSDVEAEMVEAAKAKK